jgi:hypothetical protein
VVTTKWLPGHVGKTKTTAMTRGQNKMAARTRGVNKLTSMTRGENKMAIRQHGCNKDCCHDHVYYVSNKQDGCQNHVSRRMTIFIFITVY